MVMMDSSESGSFDGHDFMRFLVDLMVVVDVAGALKSG